MRDKISKHISYEEATYSTTAKRLGIDNTPDDFQLASMVLVAEKVFEPLREHFCVPIGVTSFFRSEPLNTALRGSKTSSHMKGEAIDIDGDLYGTVNNADIFNYIADNLEFDQLIWEFGNDNQPAWVHVSYSCEGNRMQKLKAYKSNGRTAYKYI